MEVLWIVAGAAILVVTAVDTFLAVLNYNEPGLVVNRVARGVWVVLRSITRRLPRRYRQVALRQVTGAIIVSVIVTWLGGVILGFTLIYFGAMGTGAIRVEAGAPTGFWAALYLSLGQFSTVGVENITVVHPLVTVLTVFEALGSVVLLSMIIAFMFNVFNGIQMLRSLCADVSRPSEQDGTRLAALYPFFPGGHATDVERYLASTWGDLNLYGDVLRQTRTTYYFQSGDEQFSAPFALQSISDIVGALRWGLPVGTNAVSTLPGLFRMEESLAAARRWISTEILKLPPFVAPIPVTQEEFTTQFRADAPSGDRWLREFEQMNRAIARLLSPTRSDSAVAKQTTAEAYERYVAWLPFAVISDAFNTALARDLDYQPVAVAATSLPFYPGGVARALPPA